MIAKHNTARQFLRRRWALGHLSSTASASYQTQEHSPTPHKIREPLALPRPGTHSAVPAQMIYLFEGNKNKREKKENGLAKRFERVKNPATTKKHTNYRQGKARQADVGMAVPW